MTIYKRRRARSPKERERRRMAAALGLNPDLLEYEQAAAYLGIRVWTLKNWVRDGILGVPLVRVGPRLIRFRRSSLDAWLLSRERGGTHLAPAPVAQRLEAR